MRRIAMFALLAVLAAACGARSAPGDPAASQPGDPAVAEATDPVTGEVIAGGEVGSADDGTGGPNQSSGADAGAGGEGGQDDPAAAGGSSGGSGDSDASGTGDQAGGGNGSGSNQQPAAQFRPVGQSSDRDGDAGLEAPDYADITSVRIDDNGQQARLVVSLAGGVPAQLNDGEVMGVGIDIYTGPNADESSYQLFASGNADGWEPFLHRGNGVFEHPGTFRIDGSRMVFVLDWSFIGQLPEGVFTGFIDWSRERAPVNQTGGDHTPNSGRAAFRR